MPTSGYDVYIGYSGVQADFAGRITHALRNSGWTVFFRRELLAGEDWAAREKETFAASRFVIIIMSKGYFANPQLEPEWQSGLERERTESRIVVLPVRYEECEVPAGLASKVWIDFTGVDRLGSFDARIAELDNAMRQHTSARAVPSLPALKVPDDLVRSCGSGECVLFAGAGLSARAGVAPWTKFLSDLLRHVEQQGMVDTEYARSLEAALGEGERNSVADGIVQLFGNNRQPLQEFLQQYYPDIPVAEAHRLLQGIPFASVVTTNYDRLLEDTFPEYARSGLFTTRDAEPLLDALSKKRPFILKLYGLIERLETLVFAPIEYREALSSNISFSKFMEGIFFSRTFFFVGLSLEGIQDFLSGFVFRGIGTRRHFALVAVAGSAWRAKANLLLRRYNIEVIPFPLSTGFPEVETFLRDLRRELPSLNQGVTSVSANLPVTPGLRRLVLENIGPFERLEVDFPKQSNWKVLLGDNGVGKSTILKAIAVAIMGNDARSYAARLVRTGQTKGRITLYTERNPDSGYVTEILTKDVLSEAEIVSLPSRAMEAESWLALGFSPLRIVTWSPSSGPQAIVQKGRPTADDLLPLVSGETDPRMDRLKQWIVNLDSVEKAGPPRTLSGHNRAVKSIVFSHDGRTLFSGSIDGTVRVWDCWTGTETLKIKAHDGGVNSVAVWPDGKLLASGSFDRTAKTWTLSGEHVTTFHGSRSQVLSVAFHRTGLLVTGSASGSIRFWSSNGTEYFRATANSGAVWCLAISPDGDTVASGTYGGIINLNRIPTGEFIRSIEVSRGTVMGLAWSADSKKLISASRNGPVSVWDAESGAMVREFPMADTTAVAVSRDGRIVAAGTNSGEIKAWDAESGVELMKVQAHSQTVWGVAVSPDGRTLASASEDTTIKLWNLPGSMPSGNQRETIRRFFELLGVLTDRPDIEYLRVTDDFRVMVRTADSTVGVPVELLSQGMTSLFGWVGVLCQRLKETLDTQDALPTGAYALVLIDELDAHMHPAWQQVLVYRLSKSFPNVQFIATTHSPLIAADLPPEGILVLRREDGAIVSGFPDEARDIRGLRFDQILLSDVFGLNAVRGARVEEQQNRYVELALKLDRTDAEEEEFGALAEQLRHYRVRPEETRAAEEAARLIEQSLDEKIAGVDKKELVKEIQTQMLELKTPFRRESVRPKS